MFTEHSTEQNKTPFKHGEQNTEHNKAPEHKSEQITEHRTIGIPTSSFQVLVCVTMRPEQNIYYISRTKHEQNTKIEQKHEHNITLAHPSEHNTEHSRAEQNIEHMRKPPQPNTEHNKTRSRSCCRAEHIVQLSSEQVGSRTQHRTPNNVFRTPNSVHRHP